MSSTQFVKLCQDLGLVQPNGGHMLLLIANEQLSQWMILALSNSNSKQPETSQPPTHL
jgi:hypothetical protein